MNKGDKITVIFYIFLAVSFFTVIVYMDKSFSDIKMPEQVKSSIAEMNLTSNFFVNKTVLFNAISDVHDYPVISSHFVSVKIINQSNNVIFAQENFREGFFTISVLVKHTIVPYSYQTMEIMDGDAKGTLLNATFTGSELHPTLTTAVKVHLKGKLSLFAFYPKNMMEGELGKIIDDFANYAKKLSN